MVDPATVTIVTKATLDTAAVLFDSSIGCCTSPLFRVSCVKGDKVKTAYCRKCQYHYCRYHFPVNNGGMQGGHSCK